MDVGYGRVAVEWDVRVLTTLCYDMVSTSIGWLDYHLVWCCWLMLEVKFFRVLIQKLFYIYVRPDSVATILLVFICGS